MREWIRGFVQAVRGATPEQIGAVTKVINSGAPEPELVPVELADVDVAAYIQENGLPRVVPNHPTERHDN